ncbi:globin-like protein [Neoconidiobolus thromboides FSU 785]|nr:globin-like protein [Neoconidiobolus thromboides FSU 785]
MKHKYYLDLGGIEGIKELAKRVYQYHVQDVRINTFFDFTMIYRFEQMLINFLVGLLGGKPYNQRSMRKAHRRLGGLSNEHFDAFVENLLNAMKHQKVDNVAIREILHLVEETREDVTGLNELERRNYKEAIKPTTSCPFHFSLKNKTKSKKSCSIN